MADRGRASLGYLNVPVDIEPQLVAATGPGAGIFLLAEYEDWPASFSGYGRLGKRSEDVADDAVAALREHHASGTAVELADQLLLPLAVASGISTFTTVQASNHLVTNAWDIRQFGVAEIFISEGRPCEVQIKPRDSALLQ
jgi:RNA 3'-terminal phosphate cyclase (ATP)